MPSVTACRFAALARSSPWRWHSLRFVLRRRGYPGRGDWAVRGWIRRPDGLRVEQLDGTVITAEITVPYRAPAPVPVLERDAEGLVTQRRPDRFRWPRDDPMYLDYAWVAMLDPVELADGYDDDMIPSDVPPVLVDEIRAVQHYDRPAWEAVLRPTERYEPRCSCCPLLFSAQSVAREGMAGRLDPSTRFADAHRVRLDVATGVCVRTAEIGGSAPGRGHDVVIEAVDEPTPDEMFSRSHPRSAAQR